MCIENITNSIIQSNVPVLFLDTCVFLDIVRTPYRENINITNLNAAQFLKAKVHSNEVFLTTSNLVVNEFKDNFVEVHQELTSEAIKQDKYIQRFSSCMRLFQVSNTENDIPRIHQNEWLDNIKSFSEEILHLSVSQPILDSYRTKASIRAEQNIPPSRKGGSVKDCIIFESLLELAKILRNSGFNKIICFVSSNTNDFGNVNNCKVNTDLEKLNILFANQLHHACSLLGFSQTEIMQDC